MTQAFLTISRGLERGMFRWNILDLFSFYLDCYEPFLPLCNSCTENGRYQTRRGQFCPIIPREIENFSKQRNAKKCKEVQRSDCVQQKVLRVAKRWLCSTRGATRRRPCVHQGEGGRGIVRAGQIYLPLPWSLQCQTLLCLWLCWQRYIFPLDSRTWIWTWDRGHVGAGQDILLLNLQIREYLEILTLTLLESVKPAT